MGRSNNYIESFNSATLIHNKLESTVKTPIIPNSQLILAYTNDKEQEHNWDIALVITPDQNMFIILICCAFLLLIMGIMIIILHAEERRFDRKNRPKIPDF